MLRSVKEIVDSVKILFDELIGKSFGILYVEHHDYVSKWKNFTKSVSDDDIYLDERIMRRRDGSRFWCRVSGLRISSDPSSTDSLFCVESLRRPVDWEGRSLSGRQREICSLLVRGFSSQKIGEELGLVGTTAILLAFLLLIGAGLSIATRSQRSFEKLLATGLTTVLGVQAGSGVGLRLGARASSRSLKLLMAVVLFTVSVVMFYRSVQ